MRAWCGKVVAMTASVPLGLSLPAPVAAWTPAEAPIQTPWAASITPENAHAEYPRPQLVRERWLNLNGLWSYAITDRDSTKPSQFDGEILVPFPVESALSGVKKPLRPGQWLWYERDFDVPAEWVGDRVRLNFEAVDWECVVYVNGAEVGAHRGGFDPFGFDITDALNDEGPQRLTVRVWDPTDSKDANGGEIPRGKQSLSPGLIHYTSSSGIWQTAWLEPVKPQHISDVTLVTDVDGGRLNATVDASTAQGAAQVRLVVRDGEREVGEATGTPGEPIYVAIPGAKLWSPDSPFLYGVTISLVDGARTLDVVESYFGMRSIAVGPDGRGRSRLLLNGEPLFQFGPLNQDYWPESLHTPPSDEALRFDVETVKRFGGNMMRVHAKVGTRRLYYWADRLGVLVWQDMITRRSADALNDQWKHELERMILTHRNHPSIVVWVMFNESWGQFDTENVVALAEGLDPTRLVSNTSGSTDKGVGSLQDTHKYPGPAMPEKNDARAKVLGEFGGLGLPVPGHMWNEKDHWGYLNYEDKAKQTQAYTDLLLQTWLLKDKGLSAAVYTQLADVEGEANGWLTYDRKIEKLDVAKAHAAAERLYGPAPVLVTEVPTADEGAATWKYTTQRPDDAWTQPGFDDSRWAEGKAGFGTVKARGATIGTAWNTSDIWLRRAFNIEDVENKQFLLRVFHDDSAELYINGQLVRSLKGFNTSHQLVSPAVDLKALLTPTDNVLAVHCHQDAGEQNIDVGLVSVASEARK